MSRTHSAPLIQFATPATSTRVVNRCWCNPSTGMTTKNVHVWQRKKEQIFRNRKPPGAGPITKRIRSPLGPKMLAQVIQALTTHSCQFRVIPNLVDPESRATATIVGNAVATATMLFFVIARMYTKLCISKVVGWEDCSRKTSFQLTARALTIVFWAFVP